MTEIKNRWKAETNRLQTMLDERANLEKRGAETLDKFIAKVIENGESFPFKIDFSSEKCILDCRLHVHKDEIARKKPEPTESEKSQDSEINKKQLLANLDARYDNFINKKDLKIMMSAYEFEIEDESVYDSLPQIVNWNLLLMEKKEFDMVVAENYEQTLFFKSNLLQQLLDPSSILAKRCEKIITGVCDNESYKQKINNKIVELVELMKKCKIKSKQ